MKLQINITKEVLEASKMCGLIDEFKFPTSQNCAIAKAIVDVFGLKSWVNECEILLLNQGFESIIAKIELPKEAQNFIRKFDKLSPEERVEITPFSFEIDVPDEVLEKIVDITEINELLSNAKYINVLA